MFTALRERLRPADRRAFDVAAKKFIQEVIVKIGQQVKEKLDALVETNEDLIDTVEALHDRVDALEALQGIKHQQANACECDNCRLRWN